MEVLTTIILVSILVLIGVAIIVIFYLLMGMVDHARFGVQFVKTPAWVLNWLTHNLDISDNAKIFDLGCGDGLVLRYLKRAYPSAKMIGVEGAFFPLLRAKWLTRKTDVTIIHADFYNIEINDADIVFCFLTQHLMERLEKHLRDSLKKGARVYSYAFTFPTWRPTSEIPNPNNPQGSSIYVYTRD